MLPFAENLTRLGVGLVDQADAKLRNAVVCPGLAQLNGEPGYSHPIALLGKAATQPVRHKGFGEGGTLVGYLRMQSIPEGTSQPAQFPLAVDLGKYVILDAAKPFPVLQLLLFALERQARIAIVVG